MFAIRSQQTFSVLSLSAVRQDQTLLTSQCVSQWGAGQTFGSR